MAHSGPAAVFDAAGRVVAGNHQGYCLADLFANPDSAPLQAALQTALDTVAPVMRSISGWNDGTGSMDLTVLPSDDRRHVVVLARDTSLDTSLRAALAESRARFKDFVDLSSDFAWETGIDGRLVFVSPGGALGRVARDLVGSDPLSLVDPAARADGQVLFSTRQRLRDIELWARDNRGRRVRLLASAMPVIGADGVWLGARGICRDITEQHVKDMALRRAQERDRVRSHVVRTFRDQVDVETMLTVAAEALAHGVGAASCQILRRFAHDRKGDVAVTTDEGPFEELTLGGQFGPHIGPLSAAALIRAMQRPEDTARLQAWEGQVAGHTLFVVGTSYHQTPNGAVVLWRPKERGPWTADDRLLVLDVAGQVGIANEQIARYETVMDMSRTDSLTNLLNRRGFMLDVERRIRRLERSERPAALLYMDLDNFKRVNDRYGHARGDHVLTVMAEILAHRTRPTDLVARLGGDEFAVWLEDADAAAACQKADELLSGGAMLQAFSADAAYPLAMSIGVAVYSHDQPETLGEICERADAAMYAAKQRGKGRFHLSEGNRVPPTDRGDLEPGPGPGSSGGSGGAGP